jgi:hypothetical protein
VTPSLLLLQAGSRAVADSSGVERWFAPAVAGALLLIVSALLWGFRQSARDEPPRIESHWGGLGGGLGGWRMSASLGYLIAALAFGGMFTAFASRWLPSPPSAEKSDAAAPDSVRPAPVVAAAAPPVARTPAAAPAATARMAAPPARDTARPGPAAPASVPDSTSRPSRDTARPAS